MSDADKKQGTLREIDPVLDPVSVCKLCFMPAQPQDLGPLYEYVVDPETDVYRSHYFCLLFSSGLNQKGDDDEAIKGFLTADIFREWRRGARLKCRYCDRPYATVGCANKSCRKTYHLPCAIKDDVLLQFCDDFATFCKDHKPRQDYGELPKTAPSCGICLEIVKFGESTEGESLWTPCCSGWFHRSCVHDFARSSGYFFKCPLCNNKAEFEMEMKKNGVFVPEEDAAWERDSSAFDALLERHDTCDALECLCPDGRKEDVDDTDWEIVLCRTCGARGIHVLCGKLQSPTTKWQCDSCLRVLKKLPPTVKNVYCPVRRGTKKRRSNEPVDLRHYTFTVNPDGSVKATYKNVEVTKTACSEIYGNEQNQADECGKNDKVNVIAMDERKPPSTSTPRLTQTTMMQFLTKQL